MVHALLHARVKYEDRIAGFHWCLLSMIRYQPDLQQDSADEVITTVEGSGNSIHVIEFTRQCSTCNQKVMLTANESILVRPQETNGMI